MNFEKFTIKSQEVLQKAAEIASGYEQQAIEPGHLLKGILESGENVVPFLLKKLQINQSQIEQKLEETLQSYLECRSLEQTTLAPPCSLRG